MIKILTNNLVYDEKIMDDVMKIINYPNNIEENNNLFLNKNCQTWRGETDKFNRPIYRINGVAIPVRVLIYDQYFGVSDKYKFILSTCSNRLCVNRKHLYQSLYYMNKMLPHDHKNTNIIYTKNKVVKTLKNVLNYDFLDIDHICHHLNIYHSVFIELLNTANINFISDYFTPQQIERIKLGFIPFEYLNEAYEDIKEYCNKNELCIDCFRDNETPSMNKKLCQECFTKRIEKYEIYYPLGKFLFFNIDNDNPYYNRYHECFI